MEGSIQLIAKKSDRDIQLEEVLIAAQKKAGVSQGHKIVNRYKQGRL